MIVTTQVLLTLLYLAPLLVLLYAALRNRRRLEPGVALGLITGLMLLILATLGQLAVNLVFWAFRSSDREWPMALMVKGGQVLNALRLGGWVFFAVGFWRLMPWGKAESAPVAAPVAAPDPASRGWLLARVSLGFLIAGPVLGVVAWVVVANTPRHGDFSDLGTALLAFALLALGALCWLISVIIGLFAARRQRYVLWWVIPVAILLIVGLVVLLVNA